MSPLERMLYKALKLALTEFKRISYQKKADANVLALLNKALEEAERFL